MENIFAIIPARYQSSRFPGKPLALILGKPMIQWVYEKVNCVKSVSSVYVATDDKRIAECVRQFGGNAIMTSADHESGTDRIAECVDVLKLKDEDIVLNIQGDEPLIQEGMIHELISTIEDKNVYAGTLKEQIMNREEKENVNIVKVITDIEDNAIYFSRYPIPYKRKEEKTVIYYRHVGVYAYRVFFLRKFSRLPKSHLEESECLEQLRIIENGYRIKVKETKYSSLGVDTVEQLEYVENRMRG